MNATPPGVKRDGPRASLGYQFRPLPIEYFADRRISSTAKLLHAVLLDSARRRGACKLCNRTLAELIGRSVATVKRLLAELEAVGLAERNTIAGGRVRLGIVARPGVAHSRSLDARTVAQDQSAGGSGVALGVAHSLATIQSSPQSGDQTVGFIPPGKDPGEVPDPATAAAFLRSMIAKGRERSVDRVPNIGNSTAPAARAPRSANFDGTGPAPVFANCETPAAGVPVQLLRNPAGPEPTPRVAINCNSGPPAAKGVRFVDAPPAGPRYGDPRREVRSMVERLANGFTAGPVRPRRLSQAQLARQLSELRRRHGAGSRPG